MQWKVMKDEQVGSFHLFKQNELRCYLKKTPFFQISFKLDDQNIISV